MVDGPHSVPDASSFDPTGTPLRRYSSITLWSTSSWRSVSTELILGRGRRRPGPRTRAWSSRAHGPGLAGGHPPGLAGGHPPGLAGGHPPGLAGGHPPGLAEDTGLVEPS